MIILGLNAYHPDSSACLVMDGKLVAAVEEERITRVKHWAGFPTEAIRLCCRIAGIQLKHVDHIAINRKPLARLWSRLWKRQVSLDRLKKVSSVKTIRQQLEHDFDCIVTAPIHYVEHHAAHVASAYLVSPFPNAAILSVDGMGDFASTMWATGQGNRIKIMDSITFPHSLGILYTAVTQFLGFQNYGDEYKVMALAAMGKPDAIYALREMIRLTPLGYQLNLAYFRHQHGVTMSWTHGDPELAPLYSEKFSRVLEPHRPENIAASLQAIYQEVLVHLCNRFQSKRLCLTGGCAQNSVANGHLLKYFEQVYVPPAASDAGGAIGAAYWVWCQVLGKERPAVMDRADFGPSYTPQQIRTMLNAMPAIQGMRMAEYETAESLCHAAAVALNAGKLVGWFQGRMEFGPRALGCRSILADPRNPKIKDRLNQVVKHREEWRPFAPSILAEHVEEYFEQSVSSPFMSFTMKIREEKRPFVPAVQHVDGTARVQTVTRQANPLFWMLLKAFDDLTGVPMLLNTSFNDSEPIVNHSEEAIRTFIDTDLDVLCIGPYRVSKYGTPIVH